MPKLDASMKSCPMNKYLMAATFLAGVTLGPVAWWQDDPLILALAALIPFVHHLRHPSE